LLGFFYYQNQENSKKEGSSEKKFYLLSSLFVFFLLLVTFSRGAWLALLIFSFFLSVFKNPKIILYAAGVLLLITLLFEPIQNRMQDLYNPPITGSVYWRMQQWTEMGGLFIQKPLTGYGAGTETIVHESEFGFYAGNPYTHNDLLKNALEAGVMGALTYVLLLVATSIKLFGFYWKSSSDQVKTFFLVILSLFIAEAAFGMSSNILRGTAAQWSLWALTGASLAIYSIKKPGKLG
jgi:O-antigen ligase